MENCSSVKRLWQILLRAAEDEEQPLSCEDCFVVMDYPAGLLADGHPASEVVPMSDRYLRRCPGCQEEHRQPLAELARVQARQAQSR